jgi:hypothetical protein
MARSARLADPSGKRDAHAPSLCPTHGARTRKGGGTGASHRSSSLGKVRDAPNVRTGRRTSARSEPR